MRFVLFVKRGQLTCLHDAAAAPFMKLYGRDAATLDIKFQRASHIEPVSFLKRLVFRLCRRRYGDTGRVAAWTRRWRGPWRVDLRPVGGGVHGPFSERRAALEYEHAAVPDLMMKARREGHRS